MLPMFKNLPELYIVTKNILNCGITEKIGMWYIPIRIEAIRMVETAVCVKVFSCLPINFRVETPYNKV